MSAALVRQALEFVDPTESTSSDKRKKRGRPQHQKSPGQDSILVLPKNSKPKKAIEKKKKLITEQEKATEKVISKLLSLSQPTLDSKFSQKIVKRAVTGKPVIEKVKVKKEKQKSILFPDE